MTRRLKIIFLIVFSVLIIAMFYNRIRTLFSPCNPSFFFTKDIEREMTDLAEKLLKLKQTISFHKESLIWNNKEISYDKEISYQDVKAGNGKFFGWIDIETISKVEEFFYKYKYFTLIFVLSDHRKAVSFMCSNRYGSRYSYTYFPYGMRKKSVIDRNDIKLCNKWWFGSPVLYMEAVDCCKN